MAKHTPTVVSIGSLESGEHGDCFLLLVQRDRGTTRDGKPYFRVSFRDPSTTVTTMVWRDSPTYEDCVQHWKPGEFYKVRCTYFENQYGPQIDIDRIRRIEPGDAEQGFDPTTFYERSRFDIEEMFRELLQIAEQQITDEGIRELVVSLLTRHAPLLKTMAAASRNHHAYTGGFLEHVLSVTKTCLFLADKYADYYPEMIPPLNRSLVIAGAILHDIGKLSELQHQPSGAEYTPQGRLIGHILIGRDMIRDQALTMTNLDPELLLRLEHLIVAHQGIPEYGSPVPPSTPEALIVHFADDLDAKYNMFFNAYRSAVAGEAFTTRDNPLRRLLFRGLPLPDIEAQP